MSIEANKSQWAELIDFSVDPRSPRALFQQIYKHLQEAIVSGRLPPGSRLPSTRQLADRLNLSRTSTLSAYQQLASEGYIETLVGSGTFVTSDLPSFVAIPSSPVIAVPKVGRNVSAYAAKATGVTSGLWSMEAVPFLTGCSSVDAAAIDAWRRIGIKQLQTMDPRHLRYSDPTGDPELKVEVANYLRASRGVRCDPDDIIIVSGAQQGISLTARILIDHGESVWIEDPGYLPTRAALSAQGVKLVPVPIDREGMMVHQGLQQDAQAKAAYITPSHQYPTGAVMSLERRMALLSWATQYGAWVIEDDYDSEFRYSGSSLPSLQGIDDNRRVIYLGSLSKVLFPGARIGFVVAPPELRGAFAAAKFLADRQAATLSQKHAAEFMREGFLISHIRRMRQRYRDSRDLLVQVLLENLNGIAEVENPEGGIQLSIFLPDHVDDISITSTARGQGIYVRPLSQLYLEAAPRKGLLLGFSGFENHALRNAAIQLAKIIHQHAQRF